MSSNIITFLQGESQQISQGIYVFVPGKQGHLFVNYPDGGQRQWADQGPPPATMCNRRPGAITYFEGGKQLIYVFLVGENGHLYVNYWNGTQWHWADQGTPPGATVGGVPGVITYPEGGKQRIYAFVKGAANTQNLYVNYWDGSQWHWADQGTPPGAPLHDPSTLYGESNPPGVITYLEGGKQRIYAFVRDYNGHLYVNFWDGAGWHWADQGTPPGTLTSIAPYPGIEPPGVITYLEGDKQRIYAFVPGKDKHLHVNYWNGTQWNWTDQGIDVGKIQEVHGAITFVDLGSKRRIYAFARGSTSTYSGHLIVNYWDETQWNWADYGSPYA